MNRDSEGRISLIVDFTVRHDKWRGIVIEKFETESNEYFFKYHDQAIHRHCAQIQEIVRVTDVKRTKNISVDISKFQHEYFRSKIATFKGCVLESVNNQITKVVQSAITKEIGSAKRSITVAKNKQRKIEERNTKISTRMDAIEDFYKEQREIRMERFRGSRSQGPSQGSGSSQGPPPPSSPIILQRPRIPVGTVAPHNVLQDTASENPTGHDREGPIAPEIDDPMQHQLDDEDF